MNPAIDQIIYAGRRLFERKLLDMCGGNLSIRDGDQLFITTRYSGSQRHWQNQPEDIIAGMLDNDDLLADPRCSRESRAHLAIYRNFPEVLGIIHAHPFHVLPFCAASRPIEPVLEQTQKFGAIKVARPAQAHSPDLATNTIEVLRGQEATIKKQAAAVLWPHHGIVVAGKDLLAAVDALERIDWNAWCILARPALTR